MNKTFTKISKYLLSLVCLVGILCSCVEPYEVDYKFNAQVLTVEGFVTDQASTIVNISLSYNQDVSNYSKPIKGCKVEIREDNGPTITLSEIAEGSYATPATFRGQVGKTYQLVFTTPDGKKYESAKEVMGKVPEINKLYQQFNLKGLLNSTGKSVVGSTVDIYLDFKDPADQENYYLWRWKLYEEQRICITCEGGMLSGYGGVCNRINSRNPPTYDYLCDGSCWDVFYNDDVNIFSDKYANGLTTTGKLIAKVPFYSSKGALLEIEQIGITKAAYEYYKLLRDQSQTTGTLTDTPPAAIVGNIKNTADINEKVVGYFGAASNQTIRYWVDRSIYKEPLLVSILGRPEQLEPTTPFRPPSYPCILSRNRTPIKPIGWR